jgi:hypothetical protein
MGLGLMSIILAAFKPVQRVSSMSTYIGGLLETWSDTGPLLSVQELFR